MTEQFEQIVDSFLMSSIHRPQIQTNQDYWQGYLTRRQTINKNNVRDLLLQAATTLPPADLEQFRDWLSESRRLTGRITGPARAVAQETDLAEIGYDILLDQVDCPPTSQLTPLNLVATLEALAEVLSLTEFERFKTWIASRYPQMIRVLEPYDAQYTDDGDRHRCPRCGETAQTQQYQQHAGMSSRTCTCPQGHSWQVLW